MTAPSYRHLTVLENRAARQEWQRRWAAAIRDGRAQLGLSQPKLARRLAIGQSTLAAWETARAVPGDIAKVRVIAVLGLDAAKLLRPPDADSPIGDTDMGR